MHESAADRIRKKQRVKQVLADIIDNLKDYFDELQLKFFGQKSRFVVLNDIKSIHKVGSRGLQLVTAEYNSELGSLTLAIAIKQFDTNEEAIQNKILTNRLAEKLANTGILTPRVIFEHGKMLIFEGIIGETFIDSDLDHSLKLTLSGDALARYHSSEIRPVDPSRYVGLTKMVLKDLKLTPELRNRFVKTATTLLNKVLKFKGGTASFGDFHQGNILFSKENSGSKKDQIQTWLIDPEFAEEQKTADRMEDIGTFFLHTVIQSFEDTGNLAALQSDLIAFFQGYNNFLESNGTSLFDIYGGCHEDALAFHLGLNILMEAIYLQKKGNFSNDQIFLRWTACITICDHLWEHGLK